MAATLQIPGVINELRRKANGHANAVGWSVGHMLISLEFLLTSHLDHAANYQNSISEGLTHEFVAAVDHFITTRRLNDGHINKFPSNYSVSVAARKPRRNVMESYRYHLEAAYKKQIREGLADYFQNWDRNDTSEFNRGVDKALRMYECEYYPDYNVALEAGDRDWKDWMALQCEEVLKKVKRQQYGY